MPNATAQVSPTSNPSQAGPMQYAPPNWATQKALYSIVVNETTNQPVTSTPTGQIAGTNNAGSTTSMFVFDGMRQANHDQSCTPTQHPLQAGYNIADHAVLQPARVVIEAVMSDAIAAYSTGMWSGNPSKSVSAYQQMIGLMQNRSLLTLNTRLQTYTNMLLVNVKASDNQKNYYGAELVLTFQQIFIGTIAVQSNSSRSQTTQQTQSGQINGLSASSDEPLLDQYTTNGISYIHVVGSGPISSNVVNQGSN